MYIRLKADMYIQNYTERSSRIDAESHTYTYASQDTH